MSGIVWGAALLAGATSLAAPLVLRPQLARLGIFDLPNHRSSHSLPTLRGGGLAPLLGMVAGAVWGFVLLNGTVATALGGVAIAGLLVGLVGFIEDIHGIRILLRAALQFAIGGGFAAFVSLDPSMSWIWVPAAALFFAAEVNFTNFMDGINGMSCLHGVVVGLVFAVIGASENLRWLTVIGILLTFAFAAFLPWNLVPPGLFLGDVGSYLLGGTIGATVIATLAAGVNPITVLAPLAVYWADTLTTLIRRMRRREPIFQSHRTHVYQQLTDAGISHMGVASVVAGFTLATSVLGLLVLKSVISWLIGTLSILLVVATYLFLSRAVRRRV